MGTIDDQRRREAAARAALTSAQQETRNAADARNQEALDRQRASEYLDASGVRESLGLLTRAHGEKGPWDLKHKLIADIDYKFKGTGLGGGVSTFKQASVSSDAEGNITIEGSSSRTIPRAAWEQNPAILESELERAYDNPQPREVTHPDQPPTLDLYEKKQTWQG